MSLATDLGGVGLPTEQAIRLGTDGVAAVSAAGTALSGATAITSRNNNITTASSQTGVILPSTAEFMNPYYGYVNSSTTGILYPHSSSATINGGSAGAGVNIAQNKSFIAMRTSTLNWLVNVSA